VKNKQSRVKSVINSINYVQQNQLPKLNVLMHALRQSSLLFVSRPHIMKSIRTTIEISTTLTRSSQQKQLTVYEHQLNPLNFKKNDTNLLPDSLYLSQCQW